MSKRTVLTILALPSSVNVRCAKLGLVLVGMVEFFDAVVCLLASIAFWALSTFDDVGAHLGLVGAERSTLVLLLVVIVWAALKVMGTGIDSARLHLEQRQI